MKYRIIYEKNGIREEGAVIFLILFIFWIILSGKITLEIAIFGLIVTAAVWVFLCRALGWDFAREIRLYMLAPRVVLYGLTLVLEIVKSNAAVLPYALGLRKPDGVTVEFDSPLKTETANAVLANSITMTPGTITVSVKDGRFAVHCLSPAFAEGLDSSVFVRQLRKMESCGRRKKT